MRKTLVIPNYNGAENLEYIISQVLKDTFDHIYIIDDNSHDESLSIIKKYPQIKLIAGDKNLGPAGNRNRILEYDLTGILMFLDVDMKLVGDCVATTIDAMFKAPNIGIVGGLILTKKDEPMWWNYGFEMHFVRDAQAAVVQDWALNVWSDKEKIEELRSKYKNITPNLDISFSPPEVKKVDWVSEANFCIRADLFKKLGGFDPKMRYHADQDLCKRARNLDYYVMFSPEIKSMHLEIDTMGEKRAKLETANAYYFYKKHWGMSKKIFTKLNTSFKD